MKVETYEVITIDEQSGAFINEEVSEEALTLIESLGLEGQKELIQERSVGSETVVTRNPYRQMTAEEAAIFGAILPRHVGLSTYSDGPIPLRVLQVAAHARELFDTIEVWCPAEPQQPDPLLIGLKGENWRAQRFLLARWGEVLEPIEVLRDRARDILGARMRLEIAKAKNAIATMEASLEERLNAYLRGEREDPVFLPDLSFRAR